MRTMYLDSYMSVTTKDRLSVVIQDRDGNYMACKDTPIKYLRQHRKYNDLIVDLIVENKESCNKVFCHLSPSLKKAGFGKADYGKEEQA